MLPLATSKNLASSSPTAGKTKGLWGQGTAWGFVVRVPLANSHPHAQSRCPPSAQKGEPEYGHAKSALFRVVSGRKDALRDRHSVAIESDLPNSALSCVVDSIS